MTIAFADGARESLEIDLANPSSCRSWRLVIGTSRALQDSPLVHRDGALPADNELIDGSVFKGPFPAALTGCDLRRGEHKAAGTLALAVKQGDAAGRLGWNPRRTLQMVHAIADSGGLGRQGPRWRLVQQGVVPPAPGDSGTAIGVALAAHWAIWGVMPAGPVGSGYVSQASPIDAEQNDEWTEARSPMGPGVLAACRKTTATDKPGDTGDTESAVDTISG